MTVESATFLDDLNILFPEDASDRDEIDDHIRLIKSVLKATFPGNGSSDLMDAPITETKANMDTWDARVTALEAITVTQISPVFGHVIVLSTDSSPVSVTGVGFQPKSIIAWSRGKLSSEPTTRAELSFACWHADQTDPNPMSFGVDHSTYSSSQQFTTFLTMAYGNGSVIETLSVDSVNVDGFDLFINAVTNKIDVYYLAIP